LANHVREKGMSVLKKAKWVGGLAEWVEGDIAYLSLAFTWKIHEAIDRALYQSQFFGRRVIAGGPGLFPRQVRKLIEPVAEYQENYIDAVRFHNPMATRASRGCPAQARAVNPCRVPCIVPAMDGSEFRLLPDFLVRPILCDDNLSALPLEYQKEIVARYQAENIPLLDANSGFEPQSFTPEVLDVWRPINRGPWRFAYDEMSERDEAHRVLKMLKEVPGKKRVYTLIGNEPYEECMQRIREVIDLGGEPHVQPVIKLNSLNKMPWIRHDWTLEKLRNVTRWANTFMFRWMPFTDYSKGMKGKRSRDVPFDASTGLFEGII
jgi:hypothetical protein